MLKNSSNVASGEAADSNQQEMISGKGQSEEGKEGEETKVTLAEFGR